MALQRRISRRKLRQKVGRSFPVLVEGRSEETDLLFQGRLESQAPGIDGQVLINDFEGAEPRPGEFRWATITGSGGLRSGVAPGGTELCGACNPDVAVCRRLSPGADSGGSAGL